MDNRREKKINEKPNETALQRFIRIVKKNQPIGWTGMFSHMASWPFASWNGYHYEKDISNEFVLVKNRESSHIFDKFPQNELNSLNEFQSMHHDELQDNEEYSGFFLENYARKNKNKDNAAMIFIHGTMDRSNSFNPMIKKILPRIPPYITRIISVYFPKRNLSNIEYALEAKNIIQTLVTEDNLIFCGHSRGVIISWLIALYHAKDMGKKVLGCFNFAGPLKGSPLANLLPLKYFSKSIREMQTGDDNKLLIDINDKMKVSNISNYYYIPKEDWIVPFNYAYLEGQEDRIVPLDHSHSHLSCLRSNVGTDHMLRVLHGEDVSLTLKTLIDEINKFIDNRLEGHFHLFSTDKKIKIFKSLVETLENIALFNNANPYPAKRTIPEFIEAFMNDPLNANGEKPIDLISKHLTLPSFTKTNSRFFIDTLKIRYKDKPLEKKLVFENEIIENNHPNEIQSPRQNF